MDWQEERDRGLQANVVFRGSRVLARESPDRPRRPPAAESAGGCSILASQLDYAKTTQSDYGARFGQSLPSLSKRLGVW